MPLNFSPQGSTSVILEPSDKKQKPVLSSEPLGLSPQVLPVHLPAAALLPEGTGDAYPRV